MADVGDDGAVIVRIVSDKSCIREDPSTLVTVMRIAEAGGVGAPVLAKFNNGIVYGYTSGEMINPDVIPHTDHIQRYWKQIQGEIIERKWTFAI